ncbi:MAG: ribosome biogenesis GTPase Der [Chloroflexota bacterium]
MPKPLVAVVGRPNVGKSTLFNRLVGRREAIVEDLPGTTRDRLYGEFQWGGRDIAVVDTGGIIPQPDEGVSESVFEQAAVAIEEADLILFMVDVRTGIAPVDQEIAALLRRSSKPILLVVNKADNARQETEAVEFHGLGLGDPIAVSAVRGLNTGDLLDAIVQHLPPGENEESDEDVVRVAIVGRPNVGKSSLVNALTGERRAVVSPVPGTTRDAVDTRVMYKDRPIILVDTAGIRRRGKVTRGIEQYSVLRALRAVDRADVAILLVDATEPAAAQDAHVASFVLEHAKGLVVAVNKWDLIVKDSHTMSEFEHRLRYQFRFMQYVPMIFVSAETGQRIEQVFDQALAIAVERHKRIPTGVLNDAVRHILAEHQPPSSRGRILKVFYITQVSVDPPTFVIKVNNPDLVHFGFKRFLENKLRDRFGFSGTPIRLYFRERGREASA